MLVDLSLKYYKTNEDKIKLLIKNKMIFNSNFILVLNY